MGKYHPFTVGIETKDGAFTPILHGDWAIPSEVSRVFTTVNDNQTRIEVHVLQGRSELTAENRSLAKFEVTRIPPAPKGVPRIEVTFEKDSDGTIRVTAEDQANPSRQQSMTIHPSGGLSQAEVERLIAETRARGAEELGKKDVQ